MTTRRQERVSREVKELVSESISHRLNDPRIESFVSVTRVEVAADLRSAKVYLSFFGTESSENKTLSAIKHAKNRIQSFLAEKMNAKFCPVLRFYKDEKFKQAIETMRIIDNLSEDRKQRESEQERED